MLSYRANRLGHHGFWWLALARYSQRWPTATRCIPDGLVERTTSSATLQQGVYESSGDTDGRYTRCQQANCELSRSALRPISARTAIQRQRHGPGADGMTYATSDLDQ
jgi:hypothetical protein